MSGGNEVRAAVDAIAARWRGERAERLARQHLERADFDELRDAGVLALPVPVDHGGRWEGVTSLRPMAELYRHLAGADASVALVSVMHPAVLGYWLFAPPHEGDAWRAQRDAVFASALAGQQWGTITSEPGSGGDIARTKATAQPLAGEPFLAGELYGVSGDKHFGSGSGICHRMITTAVADGESAPAVFVLDTDGQPWDGSAGFTLLAEWDGMGMAATQSHGMRLGGAPAVRMAWDGPVEQVTMAAGPAIATLFTSVVLGILDEAVGTARAQLAAKADQLRAFEAVEWARAEAEHWLAVQAYEGALRAVEGADLAIALHDAIRAKQLVAELGEQVLLRLTRVLGGGTYSRRSPFARWFEDVRALGFLRPPWGLAYDTLLLTSFPPPGP
ncbi:MAG TPA: acyl-CoA dehydrogenase family protein [Acidimicrobiales bacterium]|nr:acyl-CoA dehydrogenase family protein [Acidimicrobiales bacterium]